MDTLDFLKTFLIRTLSIIVCGYLTFKLTHSKHTANSTVCFPYFLRVFFGFGSVFLPYLFFSFDYYNNIIYFILCTIFWGVFEILVLYCFILSLIWRITYSDYGFFYRSIFRRTVFFKYSQIDTIQFKNYEYHITIKKLVIKIPYCADNSDDFLSSLKKYRK